MSQRKSSIEDSDILMASSLILRSSMSNYITDFYDVLEVHDYVNHYTLQTTVVIRERLHEIIVRYMTCRYCEEDVTTAAKC